MSLDQSNGRLLQAKEAIFYFHPGSRDMSALKFLRGKIGVQNSLIFGYLSASRSKFENRFGSLL